MKSLISIAHGLIDVFADRRVRALVIFALTIIATATVLFWLIEVWPLVDAAFFSVVTISTVGYGNLTPVTALGKVVCMVYILLGLGVFVAAASAVADALIKRRVEPRDNR